MQTIIRICVLTSILSLLTASGCASKVTVKPEALANTDRITLIKVAEPTAYTGSEFGNPLLIFGALGGAVAGASMAESTKDLNQIASEASFMAGERFTRQLSNKLTASGYQVNIITVNREKKHELLPGYEKVDAAGADAILDVAIGNIGYATEHPFLSPHWRPASQVHVALIDSRSLNPIYSEKFMYGYHNPFMSGTDLDAPEKYHFKDKAALFADGSKLVEGMQDSIDAVVARIVRNLNK